MKSHSIPTPTQNSTRAGWIEWLKVVALWNDWPMTFFPCPNSLAIRYEIGKPPTSIRGKITHEQMRDEQHDKVTAELDYNAKKYVHKLSKVD